MNKVRLDIMALSHSVTQSHNYAVVLGEENGKRRLPIVIGGFEAQAIAVALGIFYAQLIREQDGNIMQIDARTSDAISMAVRYGCPIFTFEFIMESAGVILDEEEQKQDKKKAVKSKSTSIEDMNLASLEKLLDEALQKEDYEKAAQIRDIINSKKTSDS